MLHISDNFLPPKLFTHQLSWTLHT